MDVLDKEVIVTNCADFYGQEIIVAAKNLLYCSVAVRSQNIACTGPNKSQKNVEDIVRMFLEMDVPNSPVFVAKNLSDLPSLTMDVNGLKLLQEIETMKSQIRNNRLGLKSIIGMLEKQTSEPVPNTDQQMSRTTVAPKTVQQQRVPQVDVPTDVVQRDTEQTEYEDTDADTDIGGPENWAEMNV